MFRAVLISFFFISVTGFANNRSSNIEMDKCLIIESTILEFSEKRNDNFTYECSVTSSGTITTSSGSFQATLTVYGPCDSSLAGKMRDAISALRNSFK